MKTPDVASILRRIDSLTTRARAPLTAAQRRRVQNVHGVLVGFDGSRPVFIPMRELYAHTLIVGKSGRGKSYSLYAVAAQLIMSGHTVIVLDGKNDLADDVLRFCLRYRIPQNKIAVLDPHDPEFCVGVNGLECMGGVTHEHVARLYVEAMSRSLRETETRVWWVEWGTAALAVLSAAGMTAAELPAFAQVGELDAFRSACLRAADGKLATSFFLKKWRDEFTSLPAELQANVTNVVRTRGSLLWSAPALLPILGQRRTSIDWRAGVNAPGNVLLARLGLSQHMTEDQSRLLGLTLIRQITATAWERQAIPRHQRNQVFVVIDEAARYCDRELARALEVMRGLGVSFILSNQTLEQLRQEDEYVAANIIGNVNVMISFSTSRADAELMAGELYSGHMDFTRVKDEIWQTKFRPVESTRTVVSQTEADASSWGEGYSAGEGASSSLGSGHTYNEDPAVTVSATSNEQVSSASSSFSGWSNSSGGGHTTARSEATVPFYEMEEFQEVSSRSFYSAEEMREEAIGAIKRQAVQHAVVAVADNAPIPVTTPTIVPLNVPDEHLEQYRRVCVQRTGRRKSEVIKEIEERVPNFIAEQRVARRHETFKEEPFVVEAGGEPLNLPERGGKR